MYNFGGYNYVQQTVSENDIRSDYVKQLFDENGRNVKVKSEPSFSVDPFDFSDQEMNTPRAQTQDSHYTHFPFFENQIHRQHYVAALPSYFPQYFGNSYPVQGTLHTLPPTPPMYEYGWANTNEFGYDNHPLLTGKFPGIQSDTPTGWSPQVEMQNTLLSPVSSVESCNPYGNQNDERNSISFTTVYNDGKPLSSCRYAENKPAPVHEIQHREATPVSKPSIRKKQSTVSKRTVYTSKQLLILENEFNARPYLVRNKRKEIAKQLEVSELQVKIWFQNRRMKEKKIKNSIAKAACYEPQFEKSEEATVEMLLSPVTPAQELFDEIESPARDLTANTFFGKEAAKDNNIQDVGYENLNFPYDSI